MIKNFIRNKILQSQCKRLLSKASKFEPSESQNCFHGYIPSYNVSFLKRPQPPKPSTTEEFSEKTFMKNFLKTFGSSERASPQTYKDLMADLELNLNKMTDPVSFITLLHRFQLCSRYASPEASKKILQRALEVFGEHYDFKDGGDILSKAIMTISLQKLHESVFFKKAFFIVHKNRDRMSFESLSRVMQSYTYNKKIFVIASEKDYIEMLETMKRLIPTAELNEISKFIALLVYTPKNAQQVSDAFLKQLTSETLQIINDIGAYITKSLKEPKLKKLDLFWLSEALISLTTAEKVYPSIKQLNDQVKTLIPQLFDEKGQIREDIVSFRFESLVDFVVGYHLIPPVYIDKNVGQYISRFFSANLNNGYFQDINNLTVFLLFLMKTECYRLSPNESKEVEQRVLNQIKQETNILNLSKILEFYSLCYRNNTSPFKEVEKGLDILVENIEGVILQRDQLSVSAPLLQIFQLLVYVNRGSDKLWTALFNLFGKVENLEKLDYLELLIKLVPAAARKTRALYFTWSNSGRVWSKEQKAIERELEIVMQKFWASMEDFLIKQKHRIFPEKMAQILFHFVYVNMGKAQYKNIYRAFKQKVTSSVQVYSPKELSQIMYAYARVQEREEDIFFAIAERIHNENLYTKMNGNELANAYWGMYSAGFYHTKFGERCKELLFSQLEQLPNETFNSFCQTLLMSNAKLSEAQSLALTKRFMRQFRTGTTEKEEFVFSDFIHAAYSLMALNIYSPTLWNTTIDFLLKHEETFEKEENYLNHLYLIYINLHLEQIHSDSIVRLREILQKNMSKILHFLANVKEVAASKLEVKIKQMVSSNLPLFPIKMKILGEHEYLTLKADDVKENFLLLADISKAEEVAKLNDLELGTKNLILPYTVDILTDKLGFEINGPWHYLHNNKGEIMPQGSYGVKLKILEKLKLNVVEIPYFDLENDDSKKLEYIFKKVEQFK